LETPAQVLLRYVDGIMARVFSHKTILELVKHSRVRGDQRPVGTDSHPAGSRPISLRFMKERLSRRIEVAYVGDGNNVAHLFSTAVPSWVPTSSSASPQGTNPKRKWFPGLREEAGKNGCTVTVTNDPKRRVKGADVVYTDVWTSMGRKRKRKRGLKLFRPLSNQPQLVKGAKEDYIFMHCLRPTRGEEVVNEVADSENSVIFDQAENRMPHQRTLMALIM